MKKSSAAAAPQAIEMPETVRRPIADFQPVEYNPRTEEAPGLADSLASFGFLQPLVINTFPGREGRIVGGEKRWRELIAAGVTEAPVIFVRLELGRERELNIRLNRNQAGWDWGKLEEFFERGDLTEWGFESWEFGEIPPEDDSSSRQSGGAASHDTGAYLGSSIKKFEVLVPAGEYDRVALAIARVLEERGLRTNTEVFLSLLEPFMAERPIAGEEAADGNAGAGAPPD